jgi:hypothetical protein
MKTLAERIFEKADLYAWGKDKSHINNKRHVAAKKPWVKVLTLDIVEDSLANGRNLFITNKDHLKEIFVTGDIDPAEKTERCKAGCLEAARYLCMLHPGAVYEPSTNGYGYHVRMRLDTESWAAPDIQERLRHLECRWNAYKCLFYGIKQIEVKQTVTSHQEGEKWGLLCRIPGVLPDEKGPPQLKISQIQKVEKIKVKKSGSGRRDLSLDENLDLKRSMDSFKSSSYYLMSFHQAPTGGKKLVTLDFQLALTCLSIIAIKPNEDGQLPGEMVRVAWEQVVGKLGINRNFDVQRWAAIRNTLSNCQFLEWIDNRYFFSEDKDKDGKAMKWSLKEKFVYKFCTDDNTVTNISCHIDNNWLSQNIVEEGLKPILDFRIRYDAYDYASAEQKLELMFT